MNVKMKRNKKRILDEKKNERGQWNTKKKIQKKSINLKPTFYAKVERKISKQNNNSKLHKFLIN